MNTIVRKGLEKDIPPVLELVRELAIFEKAENEVEVTISEMNNWAFGKEKIVDFFVLEKDNKIVGTAIYYYKYSTWKGKCLFLEDIIVTEKERKNGYGKQLFNAVMSIAKAEQVKRMEWQVLNWNTNAIEFYEKYKAQFDNEWLNCKLVYNQLQQH